ncbi:ferredoxin [Desulfococcaceae bacterium HSG7]|nr:ferredoxin [Desulfococcaceae bacterium HSG7]
MIFIENIKGRYSVTDKCIGCELCIAIAPANFAADSNADIEYGYCYLIKQPDSAHEESLCVEAANSCPSDAITKKSVAYKEDQHP